MYRTSHQVPYPVPHLVPHPVPHQQVPPQYVCVGPVQWSPGHVVPMATTIPENNNNGSHSYDSNGEGEIPQTNHSENVDVVERTAAVEQDSLDPSPCSTLFVANLEPHQTEEEVAGLFASCEGFIKAKLYVKGGPPVCFVHFKDVSSAMQSMKTLQGYVLRSSRRGLGIRIEYARQTMGALSFHRSPTGSLRSTSTPHSDSSSTYSS
jgi:hypothetical protein